MSKFSKHTWAEVYRNSRRMTGRTVVSKTQPDQNYVWVGGWDEGKFEMEVLWGEHDAFHSSSRPDPQCEYCQAWLEL